MGKSKNYDSYIRALRWASDRIGNSGVIGFVTGSGFVEKPAMDGMRKCLNEEFSNIYVLNLRGDIRKNILSKGKAKEGQNIFGSGCMSGVAIILLVKNPNKESFGNIQYFDIGDDLKQFEKLDKLSSYESINGITSDDEWLHIEADKHNDWINKRDQSFEKYLKLLFAMLILIKAIFSTLNLVNVYRRFLLIYYELHLSLN